MGKSSIVIAVISVSLAIFGAVPKASAEDVTTIKVALTDMSSSFGMGPMGGMVGPGGQGMMGHGMMRPGYGYGGGMMGSGMMGGGMMGGGMMGGGMMQGMMGMAIRVDRHTVRAGPVKFDATNWSRGMVHEMAVVAVDDPDAALPYDYAHAKVDEDQVKILGETSEMEPNQSKAVELTLSAGSYLLICNVTGHYAAGMATPLHVVP